MLNHHIQTSGVTAAAASGAIATAQNALIDAAVREVELLEAPSATYQRRAAAAAAWQRLADQAAARSSSLLAQ